MKDAVRLLDETLQQEKKTDEALTTLAEGAVNIGGGGVSNSHVIARESGRSSRRRRHEFTRTTVFTGSPGQAGR